ncbi:MAG: methyltransferase domain-containing protein [Anaerolineae bacterium]
MGCGAGIDSLIAARMVAPGGRVIGIDMTPGMLERAGGHDRQERRPGGDGSGVEAGRPPAHRRHPRSGGGAGGREARHRPMDRVNCRGSAGSRARGHGGGRRLRGIRDHVARRGV